MFYTIPTKRGLGIEIWGSRDDFGMIYSAPLHNDIKFFRHSKRMGSRKVLGSNG